MSKRKDTNKTSDIVIGAKVTKDEEARLIKFMKKHKLTSKSEAIRKLITMTAICMTTMISACGKSGGGASGGGAAPVNNQCAGPLNGTWNRQGFPGHYLTLNADCTGYDSNCGENFTTGLLQANSTVQLTVNSGPSVCRTTGTTVTCNVAANGALTVIAINCGGGVETYYK